MPTVAIVGTGRMGGAMARALARAGHDLIVQNRTRSSCEALAGEIRARIADTPAEAAALADIVISMLANDEAVAQVYGGPSGLVAGGHPGAVFIDMSTVGPEVLRAFADSADAVGVALLDAPVSGSVSLAESGQLTLMVGGRADDLARARPVLDSLAKTIFHLGPLGSGAAMKLAVNVVVFGLNGALAEGLALAEASGVDRALAYDVIASGAAGAPYVGYKRAQFLDPAGAPVAFSLALTEKDLELISTAARAVRQPLPQTAVNLDLVRSAAASLGADRDFAAVAVELRSRRSAAPT